MMQFNMYHHYTVDEHSLRAIGEMVELEKGNHAEDLPLSTKILKNDINRTALYVALLLHDIGKGLPEAHEIVGERIAWEVCPRLGLEPSDTETIAWLIRHHLLMSDTAQKRDISDLVTIQKFIQTVNSRERLKLLLVLTVCDIRAVGPNVWNGWKAQLLRDLYQETKTVLSAGNDEPLETRTKRVEAAKTAFFAQYESHLLTQAISKEIVPLEYREDFSKRHYDAYWLGLPTDIHIEHTQMLAEHPQNSLALSLKLDPDRDATRLYVAMEDHQGLFSRMAGAIALAGASIVDAKTFTTSDGMALATFWFQDTQGHAYMEPEQLERLKVTIHRILSGEILPSEALEERANKRLSKPEKPFYVSPRVTIDNNASELYTVLEVEGRDRLGLLYDLARALSEVNVKIFSAVIATYGEHAIDVFYIRDLFGHKITNQHKINKLRQAMLTALEKHSESTLKQL